MQRRDFARILGAGAALSALPALVRPAAAADPLKVGLAGYVGSLPVPEVVQGMNAFMLGMQSDHPALRWTPRARSCRCV